MELLEDKLDAINLTPSDKPLYTLKLELSSDTIIQCLSTYLLKVAQISDELNTTFFTDAPKSTSQHLLNTLHCME